MSPRSQEEIDYRDKIRGDDAVAERCYRERLEHEAGEAEAEECPSKNEPTASPGT